jgi:hypothetical protein
VFAFFSQVRVDQGSRLFLSGSRGSRFKWRLAVTVSTHHRIIQPSLHLFYIRVHSLSQTRDACYLHASIIAVLFLHLIFCPARFVCCGLPWPSRLPSAIWYVESLASHCACGYERLTDCEWHRASLPLDLISGLHCLQYFPPPEKPCARLAIEMRSCHERKSHRTSFQNECKNNICPKAIAWSYPSVWSQFPWPPSAVARRGRR